MTITAAELLVKVSADSSDAEDGLKSFSSKLKGIGGQMAAVGGALSATVAAPLIGIAVASVKTAADFERSMNVLGYSSGASAEQMQALSDQALQLGADTVFSANEAAEGMVELSKAGMDVTDVMAAIPGVMDLAAAGAISVNEAATLAAATINTFGLEASKTSEVADILAAAANASAADISDLAFGVQNAGSVFATSGQSVQTLATMMALLANNGLNASDAATSLKTMTMRLTAPTAQAAKVMKQLGINVFDAEGNMRDYHDIVGDIENATLGLSDAQRSAAFNTIFGADAIRAANIMASEGTAGYEAMAAAVSQQGAAAEMANAQNSGLAGAMEQISGSLESLATKIALPFLDDIAAWTQTITDFVNKIGELPQPVINAALAFGAFAVAVALGMTAIGAGMLLLESSVFGPVALIAVAILALGVAVAALWAAWELNWGNIQGKTEEALGVIQPLLDALNVGLAAATTMVGSGQQAIEDFAKSIGDIEWGTVAADLGVLLALNPQFQAFVGFAKQAKEALANFTMPDLSALNSSKTKTNFQMDLVATVENLKINWDQLKINTTDFVTNVGNQLSQVNWSGLAADFTGMVTKVGTILTNAANTAFGDDNLISKEIGRIGDTFTKVSETLKGVDIAQPMTALNAGIQAAIDIVGLVKGAQLDVVTSAVTTLESFMTAVLGVASSLVAGIDAGIITTAATDLVKSISDAIVAAMNPDKLGDLGTAAGTFVSTLIKKFGDIIGAKDFATNLGTEIGKATVAIAEGAATLVQKFADALSETDWGTVSGQLATFVTGMITGMASQIGPALWKASFLNPDVIAETKKGSWLQNLGIKGGPEIDKPIPEPAWLKGLTEWQATFPTLDWQKYVPQLTWLSYVPQMLWTLFLEPLNWASWIVSLTWETFVTALAWADWLTSIDWAAFIPDISWSSFITSISWSNFIPEMSWGNFVSALDWGRFIAGLNLGGGGGSGAAGGEGGSTTDKPERVVPAGFDMGGASLATAGYGGGSGGSGVTIRIGNVNVHNDMDIEVLAAKLARRFQQKDTVSRCPSN